MSKYECDTVDLVENEQAEQAVCTRCPLANECGAIVTHLAIVPARDWRERRDEVERFLMELAEEMADRGNFTAQDESIPCGVHVDAEGYWATWDHDGEHVCSLVGVPAAWYLSLNIADEEETATCDGCENAFPVDEVQVIGNAEHGPFGFCEKCLRDNKVSAHPDKKSQNPVDLCGEGAYDDVALQRGKEKTMPDNKEVRFEISEADIARVAAALEGVSDKFKADGDAGMAQHYANLANRFRWLCPASA